MRFAGRHPLMNCSWSASPLRSFVIRAQTCMSRSALCSFSMQFIGSTCRPRKDCRREVLSHSRATTISCIAVLRRRFRGFSQRNPGMDLMTVFQAPSRRHTAASASRRWRIRCGQAFVQCVEISGCSGPDIRLTTRCASFRRCWIKPTACILSCMKVLP